MNSQGNKPYLEPFECILYLEEFYYDKNLNVFFVPPPSLIYKD